MHEKFSERHKKSFNTNNTNNCCCSFKPKEKKNILDCYNKEHVDIKDLI